MIVPAALCVVVTARPWRRLGALAVCFLIPVGAYLGWFGASHGEPGFTTFSGAFLYGRVADFASCQGLTCPATNGRSARLSRPRSATPTSTPGIRGRRSGRSGRRRGCRGTRWRATSACGSFGTSHWPTPRRRDGTSCTGSRRCAGPGRSAIRRRTCSSTPTSSPTGRLTRRSERSAMRRRPSAAAREFPPPVPAAL